MVLHRWTIRISIGTSRPAVPAVSIFSLFHAGREKVTHYLQSSRSQTYIIIFANAQRIARTTEPATGTVSSSITASRLSIETGSFDTSCCVLPPAFRWGALGFELLGESE